MNMLDDLSQSQLQEDFLKNMPKLEEGNLIDGIVVEVRENAIIVDVGLKSEGIIPREEFDELPKIGEKFKLKLLKRETNDGSVHVSKRLADGLYYRKVLEEASKDKKPVSGKITSTIKGGYQVDLGFGFSGFLPQSKADAERIENPDDLLGTKGNFYIEKLELGRKTNIVLNRRDLMIEEIKKRREDFFTKIQIGDEVEGTVKSFTSFGAFVDLGGFDGLLHINDMSWGHMTSPREIVKKGDVIKLKVIRIDPETKRINLSIKHFYEDPWASFEDHFHIDDVVSGTVTKLTDFGAFIQIAEGIEGLAHISEFSWVKRVSHPKEFLKIGDSVNAKILSYDLQQGRISLGLKQVEQNPWEQMEDSYPIGKVLAVPVKKITSAGAFVELGGDMEAFLHVDDISWTKKVKNPSSELTEGQTIEVKILEVDPESRRIKVGMKQVSDDPWNALKSSYHRGSSITGTITSKTEFGLFVRVPGGLEGLIPKSQITDNRDESADVVMEKFNVGDSITAAILEVSPEKQKMSLSLKDYMRKKEKEEISRFIHEDDGSSGFTLGDMIKKD